MTALKPSFEEGEICLGHCIHPDEVALARAVLKDGETYTSLADLFRALADPTRLTIIHALLRQELCSCDLAAAVGMSASATSQHLRVLRSLHLVKSRRAGRLVYYTLDDAHISLLIQVGLTHLGHNDQSKENESAPPALVRSADD